MQYNSRHDQLQKYFDFRPFGRNMTSKTCRESLFCWCFSVQNQFGSQKNKFIHLALENEAGLEQKQNNCFQNIHCEEFWTPVILGLSHLEMFDPVNQDLLKASV